MNEINNKLRDLIVSNKILIKIINPYSNNSEDDETTIKNFYDISKTIYENISDLKILSYASIFTIRETISFLNNHITEEIKTIIRSFKKQFNEIFDLNYNSVESYSGYFIAHYLLNKDFDNYFLILLKKMPYQTIFVLLSNDEIKKFYKKENVISNFKLLFDNCAGVDFLFNISFLFTNQSFKQLENDIKKVCEDMLVDFVEKRKCLNKFGEYIKVKNKDFLFLKPLSIKLENFIEQLKRITPGECLFIQPVDYHISIKIFEYNKSNLKKLCVSLYDFMCDEFKKAKQEDQGIERFIKRDFLEYYVDICISPFINSFLELSSNRQLFVSEINEFLKPNNSLLSKTFEKCLVNMEMTNNTDVLNCSIISACLIENIFRSNLLDEFKIGRLYNINNILQSENEFSKTCFSKEVYQLSLLVLWSKNSPDLLNFEYLNLRNVLIHTQYKEEEFKNSWLYDLLFLLFVMLGEKYKQNETKWFFFKLTV